MKKNPTIDIIIKNEKQWLKEFKKLRDIALSCDLTEELKWGQPCYTHNGRNIVLIHGFKEYCALLFMKGVLLKDTKKILIQQTKNVQTARQIRFRNLSEITALEATIKSYIKEAVKVEESGVEFKKKATEDFEIPEELTKKLKKDNAFRAAFAKLTPGRQRGYVLHFSAAKLAKTRESRIEKATPNILAGKGLND